MNLEGLIPIVCGIIMILFAAGAFPKNPKNPELIAHWRNKFGPLVNVLGPLVVLLGFLQLIGVL